MYKENNQYFDLIKLWCDSLINYQITEHANDSFVGGILCPACMGIHGRIGDAMYPFVYVYSVTGDRKYYDSAKLLFKWTMRNMLREKGQIINDANSVWYCITVFFNIALGELLFEFKKNIETEDYNEWFKFYCESTEFIYKNFFNNPEWNINYRVATAASMAIAYRLIGDCKYELKAKEFAKISTEHISNEGFLYGEGMPTDHPTSRGYRTVDIGYNVEESLPNLAIYIKYIQKDEQTEKVLISALKAHLDFMLPDGAWDNSWGTRSNKWSYWGSRTSDGCQPAYTLLGKKNELFLEAAHRNYECLRKCTVDGLLAGGLHHKEMNEPVCVHHTFCHIKSMISLAEADYKPTNISLPRETLDTIKLYTTMNVAISSKGSWTATYSCDDFSKGNEEDTPSGGAVTLLYHKRIGIILAGSPNEFKLTEAHNMQVPRYFKNNCQLARIEYTYNGKRFRNTYDTTASVYISENEKETKYIAKGMLKEPKGYGEYRFETIYTMNSDYFEIILKTEADISEFILPVVATPNDILQIDGNIVSIIKKDARLIIKSSHTVIHDKTRADRIFNMCAGLSTAHLKVSLPKNQEVRLKFSVK